MWTDLGMQSRHIADGFLSAFPEQSNEPEPKFGRLHSQGLIFFCLIVHSRQSTVCMMHVQCHIHLDLPYRKKRQHQESLSRH